MIPVRKLSSWPEEKRHRKILRIVIELEKQVVSGDPPLDTVYLGELLELLLSDQSLPARVRSAAGRLSRVREDSSRPPVPAHPIRPSLNALRHSLAFHLGSDAAEWDLILPDGNLDPTARRVLPFVLYLDDLRSPFNVGAVFRTAESFGVREILLSPGSASPIHPRAERSAAGATGVIPWRICELESCSCEENMPVFALETGGTPIREFTFPDRGVVIIGSEELGLGSTARKRAESEGGIVGIPTAGAKASLNVSVAAGILLEHWFSACLNRPDRLTDPGRGNRTSGYRST